MGAVAGLAASSTASASPWITRSRPSAASASSARAGRQRRSLLHRHHLGAGAKQGPGEAAGPGPTS
jgi:hypothetical protein